MSRETLFLAKIFECCDFQRFEKRCNLHFLDAMCGSGSLGQGIRQKLKDGYPGLAARTSFYFNDVRVEPLMKLSEGSVIKGDVCALRGSFRWQFDVSGVRYGFNNLKEERVKSALHSLFESMAPGGRLVVADLAAYGEQLQDGIIQVHSARQELAGRDMQKQGTCYVPTLYEWERLLKKTGFNSVTLQFRGASEVSVSRWAGEFGDDSEMKLKVMNRVIREVAAANRYFNILCRVSSDHDMASLVLPVMVIAGDKPA